MSQEIRVTVWSDFFTVTEPDSKARLIYPDGIHKTIADTLASQPDMAVRTATFEEPDYGLDQEVLTGTDVLVWWSHANKEIADDLVEALYRRIVFEGMGLVLLHSAHVSKIFKRLMGTSCRVKWRVSGERERIWIVEPGHPIARGLVDHFEIPETEMYGERFDVPAPDTLVFVSWFQGGEVFRSGCCYHRGNGKVFYFRPGHELYPIYKQPEVQRVLINACRWAAPVGAPPCRFGDHPSLEEVAGGPEGP